MKQNDADWLEIVAAILSSESDNLIHLALIANEDPASLYLDANFKGAFISAEEMSQCHLDGKQIFRTFESEFAESEFSFREIKRRFRLPNEEAVFDRLEKAFLEHHILTGFIFGRVRGGFVVDLGGAVAFLPGSQVDIRPVRDVGPLVNKAERFLILKMDRRRGNIVVSRRAVLEESRKEQRDELLATLAEGQILDGVVKNITDYGAFVDIGGLDGLLHVTDISWKRVNHPTEVLSVGQQLNVQVIRVNRETQRISLGMKQLMADPWEGVELKYPLGSKFSGTVTNITDYGAFVELEPGVEGLVHVSEMSWTKKNIHPGKIVSTNQEVEVMILEVDPDKRRISLGLKQTLANPWEAFLEAHPVGSVVEGEVRNITEFGLFIGVDGEVDGMVHLSDIDWAEPGEEAVKRYSKGDVVKAQVLDVDLVKEYISLGIKQLMDDPLREIYSSIQEGDRVTCKVKKITTGGIEVETTTGATGFIRNADLSRERDKQRPELYGFGKEFDALVTKIDADNHILTLSIKALEIADERQILAKYGSTGGAAKFGDILRSALREKNQASK